MCEEAKLLSKKLYHSWLWVQGKQRCIKNQIKRNMPRYKLVLFFKFYPILGAAMIITFVNIARKTINLRMAYIDAIFAHV